MTQFYVPYANVSKSRWQRNAHITRNAKRGLPLIPWVYSVGRLLRHLISPDVKLNSHRMCTW